MRGRGFLLLSVFFIVLGLASKSLGNGPKPKAEPSPPGPAQPKTAGPYESVQPGLVSLDFTGVDLVEVIHLLAQYLKLNYTIDPAVRGTVTLYSAEPLKEEDLLPILHQVLRMNNAVAVKGGDFYHIAPIEEGKGLVRPARRLGEQGYLLKVVPVRFFSVAELKKLLEPFITPHVIRSKEEARTVTEEFKERLSTARRVLEEEKKKLDERSVEGLRDGD